MPEETELVFDEVAIDDKLYSALDKLDEELEKELSMGEKLSDKGDYSNRMAGPATGIREATELDARIASISSLNDLAEKAVYRLSAINNSLLGNGPPIEKEKTAVRDDTIIPKVHNIRIQLDRLEAILNMIHDQITNLEQV